MKFHIHYPVLAQGKPDRSIKDRMILLSDSADFEIPDYSSRDLVRAATHHNGYVDPPTIVAKDDALYAKISDEKVSPTDFLRVEFLFGKHRAFPTEKPWAEIFVAQHSAIQQIRDDCGSQLASNLSPQDVADVVAERENVANLTHRNDYRYKSIDEAAFVHARTKMHEAVANLIVVDGKLWRKCRTPVLGISPLRGVPPTRAISVRLLQAQHYSSATEQLRQLGMNLNIVCGADDFDDGVARAREITARHPDTDHADLALRHADGEFVAHEPELLATDSAALGILHCAMSASERMTAKLLKGRGLHDDRSTAKERVLRNLTNASASDIVALKGLADGIARADAHGVDDELADHVRAAFTSQMSIADRREAEVVEACLDRWDNRPVQAFDLSHSGPKGGR